jgi:hypothetical protein
LQITRATVIAFAFVTVVLLGGWALTLAGTDSDRLDLHRISRIKVVAKMTVNGEPLTYEWLVPAIKHWDVPRPSPFLTMPFKNVRSAFGTVFARLPSHQALGIDLISITPHAMTFSMTWDWQPRDSPRTMDRSIYFLLDSLENPQVLIDYGIVAQGERHCPNNSALAGCRISTELTFAPEGQNSTLSGLGDSGGDPVGEQLRRFGLVAPPVAYFVRMWAARYEIPDMATDAQLADVVRDARVPSIVWLDDTLLRELYGLTKRYDQIGLVHRGDNVWTFEQLAASQTGTDHITDRPLTFFSAANLTAEDIECCVWPSSRVKPGSRKLAAGAIEYEGQRLTYDPSLEKSGLRMPALIDPVRGVIFELFEPEVKAIWLFAR